VEGIQLLLFFLWTLARCRLAGRSMADLEAAERDVLYSFPPVGNFGEKLFWSILLFFSSILPFLDSSYLLQLMVLASLPNRLLAINL